MKKDKPSSKALVYVTGDAERSRSSVKELEEAGFEVTVVKDPSRAVNIADYKDKNWKPSIYVIEVVLPLMSGFELTRRVLEKYSDGKIPVVLIAQHIAPVDKLEASQAGALALLQMPLNWAELSDVLAKAKSRQLKMQQANAAFKAEY